MNKTLLIVLIFCSGYLKLSAQMPFSTMDSVDINNIVATSLVHGDMWWNPATGTAACEFPKGSGKNCNFASSIWMSGYDGGNNLHIAAQTYRQAGNDYWPGPLDASDTLTYATSTSWAKIWKVNLTDIQTFQALATHTATNTPQSILAWPGKGNTYAQGNGGVALTITTDMAPFVDLNGNGIYEPLLGEYPAIKGNQALWWVFSDNGPAHNLTNGKPLGIEVHAMAYGYTRGTLIDDVVYYEYTMINKSSNNYSNFRISQWDDFFIGYGEFDNYIGFDSIWRMAIIYKANNDDGSMGGFPVNSYGLNPPQTAITMIVLPGDEGTNYVAAGSFDYFNNDNSIIGNPAVDTECNNYMRAKLKNGQHFTDNFTGAGASCTGYGSGPNTNYVFTGDPSIDTQWSECVCANPPGDRRFVLSSNDFTFNSGSSEKVVFALLVADSAKGCPVANFDSIKIVADTAWGNYFQQATAIKKVSVNNAINIYPNPAHDKLFIENAGYNSWEATITIYNTLGQKINAPVNKNGQKYEADISRLPCGLYNVLYRNGDMQTTARFVKE